MSQLCPSPLMMTDTPRNVAIPQMTTASLKFPVKLYRILNTPEFHDIICWLPHGRSWKILQVERFEKEVLPAFFRHGRHASFIRQVNGWGFCRIQNGPDFNSYYHKSFLRDSPESCMAMRRPTAQELADRKKEDTAPNFYLTSPSMQSSSCKQESEENATLPVPMVDAPLDYKSNLIRLLSNCSKEEKERMLNLELEKLTLQKKLLLDQLLAIEEQKKSIIQDFLRRFCS